MMKTPFDVGKELIESIILARICQRLIHENNGEAAKVAEKLKCAKMNQKQWTYGQTHTHNYRLKPTKLKCIKCD